MRTAYLLLGDRGLAEDCVQDAFLSTWRARHSLRDAGAEQGGVMAMVRQPRRAPPLRRKVPIPTDTLPADLSSRDPFAELALAADLRPSMDELPSEQREVIVLRVYLDPSVEEPARILKVATGTVESRLSRALEALRLLMDPDERLMRRH